MSVERSEGIFPGDKVTWCVVSCQSGDPFLQVSILILIQKHETPPPPPKKKRLHHEERSVVVALLQQRRFTDPTKLPPSPLAIIFIALNRAQGLRTIKMSRFIVRTDTSVQFAKAKSRKLSAGFILLQRSSLLHTFGSALLLATIHKCK